jgi:hypothetical protein
MNVMILLTTTALHIIRACGSANTFIVAVSSVFTIPFGDYPIFI